jgi:hypothetical protein
VIRISRSNCAVIETDVIDLPGPEGAGFEALACPQEKACTGVGQLAKDAFVCDDILFVHVKRAVGAIPHEA